jgi:hypothetical protein
VIVHFKEFTYTTDAQLQADVSTWFDQLHQQNYPARDIRLNFITSSRILVTAGYALGPVGLAGAGAIEGQYRGLEAAAKAKQGRDEIDIEGMTNSFVDMVRGMDGEQARAALDALCVYLAGLAGRAITQQFRTMVEDSPIYQECFATSPQGARDARREDQG